MGLSWLLTHTHIQTGQHCILLWVNVLIYSWTQLHVFVTTVSSEESMWTQNTKNVASMFSCEAWAMWIKLFVPNAKCRAQRAQTAGRLFPSVFQDTWWCTLDHINDVCLYVCHLIAQKSVIWIAFYWNYIHINNVGQLQLNFKLHCGKLCQRAWVSAIKFPCSPFVVSSELFSILLAWGEKRAQSCCPLCLHPPSTERLTHCHFPLSQCLMRIIED